MELAKAEAEPSASTLATAAATFEDRSGLNWELILD
jgi:hypothetical protein